MLIRSFPWLLSFVSSLLLMTALAGSACCLAVPGVLAGIGALGIMKALLLSASGLTVTIVGTFGAFVTDPVIWASRR